MASINRPFRPEMDWTVDADLPHRFKLWKRQVRNEIRLQMAQDSNKRETYACMFVLVSAGEQGEDVIAKGGLSGQSSFEPALCSSILQHHEECKEARKEVNAIITQCKDSYKNKIEESFRSGNPKKTWSGLNTITGYKKKTDDSYINIQRRRMGQRTKCVLHQI
ncbi:hypothetical protein CAPTEDRAFT_192057 [Capitella teleta]|uniref:Uncharacterized protein n=1 Tax=Capitella teleta TaxID=283909 RepID=R7U0M8_CAPTE|nr:hypothetical protein CAPTEDRAFT_192057 [Capitella teleta]|eukprot:ELT96750.1 hypothetical protein CAPTEDRAFT_192057 [Capitella teleta]